MADPHLKSTLERKCTEIEARLEEYRRKVGEAQSDLVHLSATIAMFERDQQSGPLDSTMSLVRVFQRSEVFRMCCVALEKAPGGLDTTELATICLRSKGLDVSDKFLRRSMTQMIVQIMQVRRKKDQIASPGKRGLTRLWELPVRL